MATFSVVHADIPKQMLRGTRSRGGFNPGTCNGERSDGARVFRTALYWWRLDLPRIRATPTHIILNRKLEEVHV